VEGEFSHRAWLWFFATFGGYCLVWVNRVAHGDAFLLPP
jgi:hypothetical protein